MKKFSCLAALCVVLFTAGCSFNKKVDITDTGLEVESCNQYFSLMECILENESDDTYSPEKRDELREEIKELQASWAELDEETLDNTCSAELAKFSALKDSLAEIWCSID